MLRKKLKAAAASRIASKRLMDSLSHASGFNVAEMRDLRQQFGDAANEEGVCGVFTPTLVATTECCWFLQEIDKNAFVRVMAESFPALASGSAAIKLFEAFDADNSGTIDFKVLLGCLASAAALVLTLSLLQEFTLGMSNLVQGDPMEKLDLMFEIFDSNGNGEIELLDLLRFVKNESDELVEAAQFASEVRPLSHVD